MIRALICSWSVTSSQGGAGAALSAFPLRQMFLFPKIPLSPSLHTPQLFHVLHDWGSGHSTPDLASLGLSRARITFLDLLAMLFPVLPRTPLSLPTRTQCQLMASLWSSQVLVHRAAFHKSAPAYVGAWDFSSLNAGPLPVWTSFNSPDCPGLASRAFRCTSQLSEGTLCPFTQTTDKLNKTDI